MNGHMLPTGKTYALPVCTGGHYVVQNSLIINLCAKRPQEMKNYLVNCHFSEENEGELKKRKVDCWCPRRTIVNEVTVSWRVPNLKYKQGRSLSII